MLQTAFTHLSYLLSANILKITVSKLSVLVLGDRTRSCAA